MEMHQLLHITVWFAALLGFVCSSTKPNILFILTDDQDVFMNGTAPMNKLREFIGSPGATFENMFVTSPLCCPSRSSILTGQYVHNHMAINNSVDGNCSSSAWQAGPEKRTFATHLQEAGYNTFFAGKYLNQYGDKQTGGVAHVPPGWDQWYGLVGNSVYYNYTLSANGKPEVHGDNYQNDYLTDVINRKAIDYLTQRHRKNEKQPFFMMLSTPSCHAPFTPAPQYSTQFSNMSAPRTPSFNTAGENKHWLLRQTMSPMSDDTITYIDNIFRNRWRTLLSVDDMILNLATILDNHGVLNSTYIVFASDNGFHLGQFSLPYDKRQFYEFDIRVPLMVRGPGIKPGQVKQDLVLNIDLAPTFLDLAGIEPPALMDGQSFKDLLLNPPDEPVSTRTDFLVEHTGEYSYMDSECPKYNGQPMGNCDAKVSCVCEDSQNNTYICVRRLSSQENLIYCGLSDQEQYVEAYDLAKDEDQMVNVALTLDPTVLESLEQSLATLSVCSGATCHDVHAGPEARNRIPIRDLSHSMRQSHLFQRTFHIND